MSTERIEREGLIKTIEQLFPADTHETGERLFREAKKEVEDWRLCPIEVLRVYAQKCVDEVRRQEEDSRNRCPECGAEYCYCEDI